MSPLPTLAEIEAIAPAIDIVVPPTPQFSWPLLNARAGCEVWVKHENHTPVGAFKVRGGLAYFAGLHQREPGLQGVVAATRGNHGQSVAFAARRHGLSVAIVVPHGNSPEKNDAMRALGAELIEHGEDFQAALLHAGTIAADRGWHAMPSFHPELVRGIAVSTLHFLRSTPPLDTVYVPIGLGSGICAMMAARDALGLRTAIVGVCSAHANAIAQSFAAGSIIPSPAATRIADGLACSTPVAESLAHIRRGVERIVTVSDDAVESALRICFSDTHNVAEGAAGAGLAAVLQEKDRQAGRRVGVVLTGGNIDRAVFARILAAG